MGPASLRTCVLLRKDRPDVEQRPEADHIGFDVANEFVVGYGLDFNGLYRNLPEICVLREHARGTG
jgi:hypoxanthine phosphoribosyltransferase